MQKLKTLKGQVEYCLKWEKKTRDCDVALTIAVWKEFYPNHVKNDLLSLDRMQFLPREDQISRIRRKYQESGQYMPNSIEVVRKRKLSESVWREFMGYPVNDNLTSMF